MPGSARTPTRVPATLLWELKALHRLAVKLEERVDDLYWRLHLAAGAAPARAPGGGRPAARGTRGPVGIPAPAVWVAKLVTEQRADGTLLVSVNGKAPFALPLHLGALLLALADDTGLSPDDGVGFKTLKDLSIRMAKRTGGAQPSPETINKYVCKLRRELLCRAGLSPDVIQTHRRLGRRLAIRRATAVRGREA